MQCSNVCLVIGQTDRQTNQCVTRLCWSLACRVVRSPARTANIFAVVVQSFSQQSAVCR